MTIPGKSAYLVLQMNTGKIEKKKIQGAETSDEYSAKLARHLLRALVCKRPNPFLKTQKIKQEPADRLQ